MYYNMLCYYILYNTVYFIYAVLNTYTVSNYIYNTIVCKNFVDKVLNLSFFDTQLNVFFRVELLIPFKRLFMLMLESNKMT